jgi:DNA-binding transcriptional LysR family regulator
MDVMLQQNALKLGKSLTHRVQVTTFDAACGIVAAQLGIAVIPKEAARSYHTDKVELIDLDEDWAARRFVICTRGYQDISNASRALLDHLLNSPKPSIT